MIKIIYGKTYEDASRNAAKVMADVIKRKPNAVLGLATGSSPIGMYQELIAKCNSGEISFADVRTVNLDEYVGLAPTHDQSYSYFMHDNLFNHVNIKEENVHLPDGLAADPAAERARYDAVIASMGGIDMQLLGIGNNGHIGFNEPADAFSKGTVLVDLTDSTIDANSRFFEKRSDVPTQAFSMGVGQILSADSIVMVAMGKGKAQILCDALFGDITPRVPASALQLFKGDVFVCADADALSVIAEKYPEILA